MNLGRRAFLIAVALLSPLGVRRGLAQPVSVGDFVRLSTRLTGRPALDPQVASTYLKALLSVPGNAQLLTEISRGGLLRAQMTPAQAAVEREIVLAWYTGTYPVNGQTQLATHTGALVWRAIGRPAPGTCTGPAGAWSRPPQPVQP